MVIVGIHNERHVAVSAVFLFVLRSCAGATALHPRPSTSALTACATAANHRAEGDRFPTSKRRALLKKLGAQGRFYRGWRPGGYQHQFRLAGSQREARRGPCLSLIPVALDRRTIEYLEYTATRAHGHTSISRQVLSTRIQLKSEVLHALRNRLDSL
jgi:hypothetical protein